MMMSASPARGRSPLARTVCGISLVIALLVATSGCGGGPKGPANSVSGKVTLGADPVNGTVVFIGPDGKQAQVPTSSGEYVLADPPVGKCKILVKSMGGPLVSGGMPPPKDAPAMPKAAGVSPPAKYGDARTSDLSYDVAAGKQTHNIELKP